MGTRDYYAGALKGSILKQFPQAIIVDLSHEVKPFFVPEAAMIVKNAYRDFPKGTVHIIGITPEQTSNTEQLAVQFEGQYFISADNGTFPLIFDTDPQKVVDLSLVVQSASSITFPTKDIFSTAACHLAKGGIMEVLGRPNEIKNKSTSFVPTNDGKVIRGLVIHIDVYGNVITNIDEKLFQAAGQGKPFQIWFRKGQHVIDSLTNSYTNVPEGEKLALFGRSGFLEIAMNRANAAQLLGLKRNDFISVEFK